MSASLKLLEELLAERPDYIAARLAAAGTLEALSRFDEAIAHLDRILTSDPAHPDALTARERIGERTGDGQLALATWTRAIERFPERIDYQLRREQLRLRVGDERRALTELSRLARTHAGLAEATLLVGYAARCLERYGEALQAFKRASQSHADRARVQLEIAYELYRTERFGEALEALGQFKGPNDVEARALQLLAHGRRDEAAARRAYSSWIESERRPDALLGLASVAFRLGCLPEFVSRLQTVAGAANAAVLPAVARYALLAGEPDRARQAIATIDEQALPIEALQMLAEARIELGDRDALNRTLETLVARTMASNPSQSQLNRALELCDDGGADGLRQKLLEEPPTARPWQMPSATLKARIAAADGRSEESARQIDREAQANPEFPADRWRARLAHAAGDFRKAVELLRPRIETAGPQALQDVRLWIRALIDAEEVDQASAAFDRFAPDFAERDLVEERADLLRMNLRLDEEYDCIAAAHRRDPLDETFAARVADWLLENGRAAEARPLIERWLALRPFSFVWMYKRMHCQALSGADWLASADALEASWQRGDARARIELDLHRVHLQMRMGRHEEADLGLARFDASLAALPVPQRVRNDLEQRGAHTLTWLGRHAEARPIFDRLLARPMATKLRDELLRLVCANESFGGGDLQRLVQHRRQISNARHHFEAAPFEPTPAPAAPVRALVLLHLFHLDLWPDLRARLANLAGTDFQLCVGIRPDVADDDPTLRDVRAFAPNVRFLRVENRGFDVGSHWQALDGIDLRQFDVVALLQTKKSRHTRIGAIWRGNLVDAMMGSPERWRANLAAFAADRSVGMIASAFHQSSFHPWWYRELGEVLRALQMPTSFDSLKALHEFATGTMFLIRGDLLGEIHARTRHKVRFPAYDELSAYKRLDHSHAHAMERAFGMYVRFRGHRILWRP